MHTALTLRTDVTIADVIAKIEVYDPDIVSADIFTTVHNTIVAQVPNYDSIGWLADDIAEEYDLLEGSTDLSSPDWVYDIALAYSIEHDSDDPTVTPATFLFIPPKS